MRPPAVVAIIPARAGSKGIAGKNLRTVAGRTLVSRAVQAAKGAGIRVVISTDHPTIEAEAVRAGAETPGLRPAILSGDNVTSVEVLRYEVDRLHLLDDDIVVLLQPTSPFRLPFDINACISRMALGDVDMVVTVTRSHGHPAWSFKEENGLLVPWESSPRPMRRQDLTPTWHLTGSVYVARVRDVRKRRWLMGRIAPVEQPPLRAIDIDDEPDLRMAEALAELAMSESAPVLKIGRHAIGGGSPAFIIAEAGVNHNGSVDLAHEMIDVAAAAGANAIKFQTFDTEVLVSESAQRAEYQSKRLGEGTQREMLSKLQLPAESYERLKTHAEERNLVFLSTPFEKQSADLLESIGVHAFKISSGDLTDHEFLQHVARKGIPMIVSTGMATMEEVLLAQAVIHAERCPYMFLHCTSDYPPDPSTLNLRVIPILRRTTGVMVGYSDHAVGAEAAIASVALGASLVEKHFTLDRDMDGPDHAASATPDELREYVRAIRTVELMLGREEKKPSPAEMAVAAVARKSLVASRDLAKGHSLQSADIVAQRPGSGIPPFERKRLEGRCLSKSIAKGHIIEWGDVQ